MCNKKMSDVYTNLPWREDGNVSFLYVEPEQNVMIAKSVNNHDRLTEENKQLREFVKMIANGRTNDPESAVIHLKIHSNTAKEILNIYHW